jgi:hypothetical protein
VSEAFVLHALTTSDVRVAHESRNCRIASGSMPEELATKARADAELWGPIIKAANIKGE